MKTDNLPSKNKIVDIIKLAKKCIFIVGVIIGNANQSYGQLSETELQQLAVDYAPQFRFYFNDKPWPLGSDGEHYTPSSVEWYMNRVQLYNANGPDIAVGDLNENNLTIGASSQNDYMNIVDQETKWGNVASRTCYVHIRKSFNSGTPFYSNDYDIQYWLFYPFNGAKNALDIGEHEGDWEFISIKVDGITGAMKKVYFSAHGSEGRWRHYDELQWHDGKLVVFVSWFGHANHHYAGNINRPNGLIDDKTSNEGFTKGYTQYWFDSWQNLEFISIEIEEDEYGVLTEELNDRPRWLDYQGRWGGGGTQASSPRGPIHQDSRMWNGYFGREESYDVNGIPVYNRHYNTADIYTGLGAYYDKKGIWTDLGDCWENYRIKQNVGKQSFRVHNAKKGVVIKIQAHNSSNYITILFKKDIVDEVIRINDPTVEVDNANIKITNAWNMTADDLGDIYYEHPVNLDIVDNVDSGLDYHWAENELTADNTIASGATANYYSDGSVILKPGFWAKSGSVFEAIADIGSCRIEDRFNSVSNKSKGNGKAFNEVVSGQNDAFSENEESNDSQISVYPNPVKDQLHITLPAERELLNVTVYTINGEQVATTKSTTVSVAALAAGVYFVEIQLTNRERITKKVIISRD